MRGQLFQDEEFSPNCTAPTTGGTAYRRVCWQLRCFFRHYDRVSDAEAKQRADFDIRWKVALGIEVETGRSPRVRFSCFGRA